MILNSSSTRRSGVLLFLLSLLSLSTSWGPTSHSVFSCLGILHGEMSSPVRCLQNPAGRLLAISSSLPDAFLFGSLNVSMPHMSSSSPSSSSSSSFFSSFFSSSSSSSSSGGPCTGLSYVHDPIFAGEQLLFAWNWTSSSSNKFPTSSAQALAQGFISHLLTDVVGFHQHGLLHPPQHVLLWLPMWSHMTAIDVLVFEHYKLQDIYEKLPVMGDEYLADGGYEFMHEAMKSYAKDHSDFKPLSAETIRECVVYWGQTMRALYNRTQLYLEADPQQKFLKKELTYFTGYDNVEGVLQSQTNCAIDAIHCYIDLLLNQKVGSQEAYEGAVKNISANYQAGRCLPKDQQIHREENEHDNENGNEEDKEDKSLLHRVAGSLSDRILGKNDKEAEKEL